MLLIYLDWPIQNIMISSIIKNLIILTQCHPAVIIILCGIFNSLREYFKKENHFVFISNLKTLNLSCVKHTRCTFQTDLVQTTNQ